MKRSCAVSALFRPPHPRSGKSFRLCGPQAAAFFRATLLAGYGSSLPVGRILRLRVPWTFSGSSFLFRFFCAVFRAFPPGRRRVPAGVEGLPRLRPAVRPSGQGDSIRRIWKCIARWQCPPAVVPFAFSGSCFLVRSSCAVRRFPPGRAPRSGRGWKGPRACGRLPGRHIRATRFAGYGRFWPIGPTSGLGCRWRCRIQVLSPNLALLRSFPACAAGPLALSLWRSEKSFRLVGYDFCRFSPIFRGDSLRRVWEMAFVAAVPPAGVSPLSRLPLILDVIVPPHL